jgi:hypothetical protein
MPDPEKWLTTHAPGYAALRSSEREAIAYFCLLWSLFEAQKMESHANAQRICDQAILWGQRGSLNVERLKGPLRYFRDRYFSGNELTYHFHGLHFRRRDRQQLVERVLNGATEKSEDVVAALLLISYRLRNNLFHGAKWGDELKEQEENFKNAKLVLMSILEIR